MNETDDPLTDQDKLNLCAWSDKFYDKGNLLLDFPYEPSLGHYPPNLDFTDPEDPAGQPDDHYFLAAGQEPPTAAPKGRWYNNKEFNFFLFALALFLVVLIFYPVS